MASGDRFDPYRVLGVERGATSSEVARAYRRLAKRAHPDLHGPDASRRMRELNRAWEILSDPARRRDWDAAVAGRASAGPHWAPREHRPTARSDEPDAGARVAWEARPSETHAGRERVRVAEGWPRRAAESRPAPRALRDSPLLAVVVAAVIVVAVITLGWIASTSRVPRSAEEAIGALGITPTTSVRLDADHAVVAFRPPGGGLGIAAAERDGEGWQARVLVESAASQPISVLLFSDASDPGDPWPTVVYGRAPAGIHRVRLIEAGGVGGGVENGTWAIGLREALEPGDLHWELVDREGRVRLSGDGEWP